MADTKAEIYGVRFVTREALATRVYVLYGPASDGTLRHERP